MKCLVIDDDCQCIEMVETKLKEHFEKVAVDVFQTPPTLEELREDYDLLFIDVLLGNDSGIQYADRIKDNYPHMDVVFLSHQDNLIFEAQKVSPLCFMRKNNFDEDFQMFSTLYENKQKEKIKIDFQLNQAENKTNETSITLYASDIVYVECYSHELIIHTYTDEHIVKMTLKEFLSKVVTLNCFTQVHRAYVINMNYVLSRSKTTVQMVNKDSKNTVPVSRRFKSKFDRTYGEFQLL